MYARVTLLEIDTLRTSLAEALELFRTQTLYRSPPGREEYEVLLVDEPNTKSG